MSSSSEDHDSGAEEEGNNEETFIRREAEVGDVKSEDVTPDRSGRIVELLHEELEEVTTPPPLGNGRNIFKTKAQLEGASEDGSTDATPQRTGSPVDSMLSVPDDTPSVQVSLSLLQT